MFQILLNAAILSGALYLFARHEADYSFYKVGLLACGVSVVTFLIQILILRRALWWLSLSIGFVLCAGALVRFCYVSWGKALWVTAVYTVLSATVAIGFAHLTGPGILMPIALPRAESGP